MSENWKKALLTSLPIFVVVLVALGWRLFVAPAPQGTTVSDPRGKYETDLIAARGVVRRAKAAYEKGAKVRGPGGIPDLVEAKKLCEECRAQVEALRERDSEPLANVSAGGPDVTTPLDELDQELTQLTVMTRRQLIDRDWNPAAAPATAPVSSPR